MKRSEPVFILTQRISFMLQEVLDTFTFNIVTSRQMQRRASLIVLDIERGSNADKGEDTLVMTLSSCVMQRNSTYIVFFAKLGAVAHKQINTFK